MFIPLVSFFLLSLITQAIAQFDFPSPASQYDAPPLEIGVLGVTAFFTLTTLIQLVIVSTYLIRGRSPHILPAVLIVLGILFSLISYVLRVVQNLAAYESFNPLLPETLVVRVDPAWRLFTNWADPLIFVAVALIVRDRYRTHRQTSESDKTLTKPLPIELFMIPFYVLAAFVTIFSSAYVGVEQTFPTIDFGLSDAEVDAQRANFNARVKVRDNLVYTSETMYCLATVMLVPLTALVRSRIRSDKVRMLSLRFVICLVLHAALGQLIDWTLFAIIPFLCLRIIPQIVILVEGAKPILDTVTLEQLDLASIITDGAFYFIVFCFFSHIFVWTRLWDVPGEQSNNSYGYTGGQMPLAQFPGQWGYPQGGAYMYVQSTPGMQYPPVQGQFQGVHGQIQQYPLPQTNGQNASSGQVTQHPLPQTQQVSGPETALPAQPSQ
ncbi:hypothetical protein BU17DRAFT_102313 [Hysterangium stoloniferum]|nr:hypothetical protein BU17DRAFT_102313 [Hysterangium stoloniferum]